MTALDHLILAAPDLERTVAWLEEGLGIRLAPGGSHPTAGTRNFLLGLGDSAYLEVLGPDTGQSVPPAQLPFGLGQARPPPALHLGPAGHRCGRPGGRRTRCGPRPG